MASWGTDSSRPRRRALSPITGRILALNLVALGVLVAGLLYLGEYRKNLIAAELAALGKQAEMSAAAIGEGSVITGSSEPAVGHQALSPADARQMVRRLVEPTDTRARLFGADGVLIVDSRMLFGPGGMVQVEELPPPDDKSGVIEELLAFYDFIVTLIPGFEPLPAYRENSIQQAADYREVVGALNGDVTHAVRTTERGMMLTAAAPVQRYKQVLGALMLSTDSRGIDNALYDVRLDILKVFAVALSVTVLLSLYLASTIARPIRRLADAAESVRHARNRSVVIPTFPGRDDEIGELAQVLNEMTEALWQRMDAIEGFAADVAHEIKNPLTSLHSAVETISRVSDPAQQRKLMGIIQDDVRRLDRLITDISDASRLDAELSRAELEAVNLSGLLGVVVDIQRTTGAGGPDIALDIPGEREFRVRGIEGRLVQVFRNLIANAVSFSPPGGKIAVRAQERPGAVEIEIVDEGPGIPAGKERDIFERFYSERPVGEKYGTHSGLGLSISKQIVETHGGRVWAENRLDEAGNTRGARFVVWLPIL
ncbi:stimulus-sensing domain-containing protein [Shumkonia mesophila]|uniref:stimulus-sensing domain-containing protein n=1 Tax=Shumkonia mesophila TaxID=2838854 RepID=UPI002935197A|nr:stimulus-sensing domain-containing protein [Shumkonia mesophila]